MSVLEQNQEPTEDLAAAAYVQMMVALLVELAEEKQRLSIAARRYQDLLETLSYLNNRPENHWPR